MEKTFLLKDEKATKKIGFLLGLLLQKGDYIALNGDLGAGKTTLSKGIGMGLGFSEPEIVSPTFTIMNTYENEAILLQHFDFYRVEDESELYNIGFGEFFKQSIVVVEWNDLYPTVAPKNHLSIKLENIEIGRKAVFKAIGERYENIMKNLLMELNDADFSD